MAIKDRPQWAHALAGGTAGLTSSLLLHPLDVVKTRLQVQDGAGALPAYRGTLDALRSIYRQEGWRALYAGLTPALAGSGMAWAIYFFAYNRAKQRYQRRAAAGAGGAGADARLPPTLHLASAAEAGALVCLVTNPVWVVKTRLQLQRRTLQQAAAAATAAAGGAAAAPAAGAAAAAATAGAAQAAAAAGAQQAGLAGAAAALARTASAIPRLLVGGAAGGGGAAAQACAVEYRGFLHCFVQIARCEGLPGLYKGLLPSLLLVSHGAIQFAVYEELKVAAAALPRLHTLAPFLRPLDGSSASGGASSGGGKGSGGEGSGRQHQAARRRELSAAEITACGALSKLAASVATYPSQVLRSRLQQRMDCGRSLQYTGVADVVRKTLQREGLGGFYKGLVPNALRVAPQSAITFLVYESVLRLLAAGRHDGGASGGAAEVHASGGGSGARPARR